MKKLAAILTLFWLNIGSVFAQSGYMFSIPPGWQQSTANGAVVLAPANTSSQTAIILLPLQPLTSDFNGQFSLWQKTLEQTFKLSPIQVTPPAHTQSNGANIIMSVGNYNSANGPKMLIVFARAENNIFGMGVLISSSMNAEMQEQIRAFISTLSFGPDASQIASRNTGNLQNGMQAPQQQTGKQPQQNGDSGDQAKLLSFKMCLEHCTNMLITCNTGSYSEAYQKYRFNSTCQSKAATCNAGCDQYRIR
jgi:hypothetical protein